MEAARQLDIIHSGVTQVRVEVVNSEIAENARFESSIHSIPKKSLGVPFRVTRPLYKKSFVVSEGNNNFPYAVTGNGETD